MSTPRTQIDSIYGTLPQDVKCSLLVGTLGLTPVSSEFNSQSSDLCVPFTAMFISLNSLPSLPSTHSKNKWEKCPRVRINKLYTLLYHGFFLISMFTSFVSTILLLEISRKAHPTIPILLCKGLNKLYTSYSDTQIHLSLQPHDQTSLCS